MTNKKLHFTTEKKKIIEAANKLSDEDVEQLRFLAGEITSIRDSKHITVENVKKLDNLINQLLTIRSRHVFSLVAWLKQKYVIDA
jgi:hypothetical protein